MRLVLRLCLFAALGAAILAPETTQAQNPTVDLFRTAQTLGAPTCTVESCLNVSVDSVAQALCTIIVLDGSSSMTEDSTIDMTMTRFQGAVDAIDTYIDNMDGVEDQIGVVVYGTEVNDIIAVTTNTAAAKAAVAALPEPFDPADATGLEQITCGLNRFSAGCPIEFTNLADGFRAGIQLADDCEPDSKPVIIVTSDGVANTATIGGVQTSCTADPTTENPFDYPNACTDKAIALTDTALAAGLDVYSIAIDLDELVPFDSLGIVSMEGIASDPTFFYNTIDFGGAPPVFDDIAATLALKSITNTVLSDTVSTCWSYIPGSVTGAGEPVTGTSGPDQTLQWDLGEVVGNDTTTVCYEMEYDPVCGGNNPTEVEVNLAGGAEFTQSDLTVQSVAADTVLVDLTVCTNLPVELTHFGATVSEQDVTLEWATASELNNAGFGIEHAIDGGFYSEIEFVEGHGTTNRAQTYSYLVNDLEPGTHFFRLKQVDFDGTIAFSPEVEVSVEVPDDYYLSEVYPNPFNPEAAVRFWVANSQRVEVTLHDVTGRIVAKLYDGSPASKSLQTVRIDGSRLSSGTYLIRVAGEAFVDTRSVILLK